MTTPTRDDGLPEPVAWLQVGVFDGPYEGETLTRAKLPLKYDPSWWRFDGLYSGDQMRAYGDARAAAAMAEATKYRRTLEWLGRWLGHKEMHECSARIDAALQEQKP